MKIKATTYFWVAVLLLAALFAISCAQTKDRLEATHYFKMDTYIRLLTAPLEEEKALIIEEELTRLEQLFDRFSLKGGVNQINEKAGTWVNTDETIIDLLKEAKFFSEKTDGAFDPTIGPLTELWQINTETADQFKEDWHPPFPALLEEAIGLVDYRLLEIRPEKAQVKLHKPNMNLDVGGIAKGYAVDRLAEMLRIWGITQGLIDFGGDIFALGEHPDGRPWQLGISNPLQPEEIFATVSVIDKAIATSGSYQRYRIFDGKHYSHLLDPRTGHPAEELASVTIVAEDCITADALSTAVFILGWEKGQWLVKDWPGVEALIIDKDLRFWVSDGLKDKISFSQ